MNVDRVLEALKDRPLTVDEISEATSILSTSVRSALKRLIDIECVAVVETVPKRYEWIQDPPKPFQRRRYPGDQINGWELIAFDATLWRAKCLVCGHVRRQSVTHLKLEPCRHFKLSRPQYIQAVSKRRRAIFVKMYQRTGQLYGLRITQRITLDIRHRAARLWGPLDEEPDALPSAWEERSSERWESRGQPLWGSSFMSVEPPSFSEKDPGDFTPKELAQIDFAHSLPWRIHRARGTGYMYEIYQQALALGISESRIRKLTGEVGSVSADGTFRRAAVRVIYEPIENEYIYNLRMRFKTPFKRLGIRLKVDAIKARQIFIAIQREVFRRNTLRAYLARRVEFEELPVAILGDIPDGLAIAFEELGIATVPELLRTSEERILEHVPKSSLRALRRLLSRFNVTLPT